MEWEKTTFGELKAGDVFTVDDDKLRTDLINQHGWHGAAIRTDVTKHQGPWYESDTPVYRLISSEREALEKIVAKVTSGLENHLFICDLSADLRICRAIATAALEGKEVKQ